jgi:hypothetical protein
MIPREWKRLAEVDFPLLSVWQHAAREKPLRQGHPTFGWLGCRDKSLAITDHGHGNPL